MKDLCTLDLIPDLVEAGVYSMKIEGRMKSPRYTAGVVRIYRKYVDIYLEKGRNGYCVDPGDRQELLELFDRGGFTDGYYRRSNGREMIAVREKPAFRQGDQRLFDELDRLYVNGEKKEPVEGVLTVREGQEVCLELKMGWEAADKEKVPKAVIMGPKAESARNQPISVEQLRRQIQKTGDMPFVWRKLDICLEGQVFLPVQAMNELRRHGLEQLRQNTVARYHRRLTSDGEWSDTGICTQAEGAGWRDLEEMGEHQRTPGLHVLLASEGGLSWILDIPEVSVIYMEADAGGPGQWREWVLTCHAHQKSCVLAMPVIFRKQAERFFERNLNVLVEAGFDGILVRSLEEIGYLRERGVKIPVYGDHNLYSFNSASQSALTGLGCQGTTFPLELNSRELGQMGGEGRELIVYGFLPSMVSAQCVQKTVYGCSRKPGRLMMRDRTGKELPVDNHCLYCYNMIYNPLPLSLLDQTGRIKELAPEAVRIQFTGEDPGQIRQIVTTWADQLYRGANAQSPCQTGDFTRGHFRRGVE